MITMVDVLVDGLYYGQFALRYSGAIDYMEMRREAMRRYPTLASKAEHRVEVFAGARRIARLPKGKKNIYRNN